MNCCCTLSIQTQYYQGTLITPVCSLLLSNQICWRWAYMQPRRMNGAKTKPALFTVVTFLRRLLTSNRYITDTHLIPMHPVNGCVFNREAALKTKPNRAPPDTRPLLLSAQAAEINSKTKFPVVAFITTEKSYPGVLQVASTSCLCSHSEEIGSYISTDCSVPI